MFHVTQKFQLTGIHSREIETHDHTNFTYEYLYIQPVHPKGDQSWVFIGRTNC